MATTAVVAGTAGAVHHRQENRYQQKAMEQQQDYQTQQAAYDSQAQIADLQAQVSSMQAQQGSPPAGGSDMMAQLQQLSTMQAAGLLTPEQFEAAKNKLLAN
ncbi:MAG TPA: SHOCT domain-containing protein [Thermomicrobiales bacterium]|nr:SHOCT domain-containing protein [Thermomicrobiales bacterium]